MTSELLDAVLTGDPFGELVEDALLDEEPDAQLRTAAIAGVLVYVDADKDERAAIRDDVEAHRRKLRDAFPALGLKETDENEIDVS